MPGGAWVEFSAPLLRSSAGLRRLDLSLPPGLLTPETTWQRNPPTQGRSRVQCRVLCAGPARHWVPELTTVNGPLKEGPVASVSFDRLGSVVS